MGDPTHAAGGRWRQHPGRSFRDRAIRILEGALDRLAPAPPVVRPSHPAGHYYSPVPSLADIQARELRLLGAHEPLAGVDINDAGQVALVRAMIPYYAELPWGDAPGNGRRFGLLNVFYSFSDAIFLYGVMRHFRPRRVIEVGSGHSSCAMLDTSEIFFGGAIDFTFIEPFPGSFLSMLKPEDRPALKLLEAPVQDVPLATFDALQANDILFVDSSHVSKFGSDLNHILFDVLPRLAPGVIVHFHDVYYPFEYPREVLYSGIAWNEAYLLRAFLQYNTAFEILLFTTYVESAHQALVYEAMPLCRRNPGGSLWLRRR